MRFFCNSGQCGCVLRWAAYFSQGAWFYFTMNDRAAVSEFQGGGSPEQRQRYIERIRPEDRENWLKLLEGHAGYKRFAEGDAQMVTMGDPRKHRSWGMPTIASSVWDRVGACVR